MLAWFEAERRKRPCEPSLENHDKGERKTSNEGVLWFHLDDVAVELIVNTVNQIRGCSKEGVVRARASTGREVGVRKQGPSLKKVVS